MSYCRRKQCENVLLNQGFYGDGRLAATTTAQQMQTRVEHKKTDPKYESLNSKV